MVLPAWSAVGFRTRLLVGCRCLNFHVTHSICDVGLPTEGLLGRNKLAKRSIIMLASFSRLRRVPVSTVTVAVAGSLIVGAAFRLAEGQTRMPDPEGGTLTLRGGYGSIDYFENFDNVMNSVTMHAPSRTNAPAYDLGLTSDQPFSDQWTISVVADWIGTDPGALMGFNWLPVRIRPAGPVPSKTRLPTKFRPAIRPEFQPLRCADPGAISRDFDALTI